MNGKITASPKVKEVKSYRRHHFLNGSAYRGLRPDADTPPDDYSYIVDYKWTQYFDVSYGVVAENRVHDPDAESGETNSEKYKLFNEGDIRDMGTNSGVQGRCTETSQPPDKITYTTPTGRDSSNTPKRLLGVQWRERKDLLRTQTG